MKLRHRVSHELLQHLDNNPLWNNHIECPHCNESVSVRPNHILLHCEGLKHARRQIFSSLIIEIRLITKGMTDYVIDPLTFSKIIDASEFGMINNNDTDEIMKMLLGTQMHSFPGVNPLTTKTKATL